MKCPFCGGEMIAGHIREMEGRIPVWMPGVGGLGGVLTRKRIERAGGRILGTATNIGLIAKELCASALCETCNLLITQL